MAGYIVQAYDKGKGSWETAVFQDPDGRRPTVFATSKLANQAISVVGLQIMVALLSGAIDPEDAPAPNDFRVVPADAQEDPPVESVAQAADVLKKFTVTGGV